MPKKEIKFLSQRYIVDACLQWFNYGISFNTSDRVKQAYYDWLRRNSTSGNGQQDFEDFLFEWIEDDKLNKEDER